MAELFSIENFFTLLMLVLLQAVLGFDNLLYVSLESRRVTPERQAWVRRWGIGLAIFLRMVLLFVVVQTIAAFKAPFFELHWPGVVEAGFNLQASVTLLGGAFILYTATKEIFHMLNVDDLEGSGSGPQRSVASALTWIILMNLVFSFDSILSAMALSDVFSVMATAIVISGILMIWLADRVSQFLERNRTYEVLGLFILFIVGILLVSEGGHHAHLKLFGREVTAMSKTTFYFVIGVLVIVDVVQGRYLRKLDAQRRPARTEPLLES